jgi:DNA-binding PadR family transcriptional regulator
MLELAILGLLQENPMHGYELRKELATKLGTIRAAIPPPLTSRRGRVVYKITAEGKERFAELLAQAGPETYDDAGFGVHFAFFSRTDRATRLRILEGRRRRIEERREGLRDVLARASDRLDAYTLELQRHGLDACEREVRWLEELITNERSGRTPSSPAEPAAGTPPKTPAPHEDRP